MFPPLLEMISQYMLGVICVQCDTCVISASYPARSQTRFYTRDHDSVLSNRPRTHPVRHILHTPLWRAFAQCRTSRNIASNTPPPPPTTPTNYPHLAASAAASSHTPPPPPPTAPAPTAAAPSPPPIDPTASMSFTKRCSIAGLYSARTGATPSRALPLDQRDTVMFAPGAGKQTPRLKAAAQGGGRLRISRGEARPLCRRRVRQRRSGLWCSHCPQFGESGSEAVPTPQMRPSARVPHPPLRDQSRSTHYDRYGSRHELQSLQTEPQQGRGRPEAPQEDQVGHGLSG